MKHFFKTLFLSGCLALVADAVPLPAVAQSGKTYTNSIGTEFIQIPTGSFIMGADKNFEDARDDETPPHRVTISQPFYLGKYEVTQGEWVAVMENNPSAFKERSSSNPVENVSWNDVQSFIQRLSAKERKKYRLPTEAEWEYAARAGTKSTYSFGNDARQLGQYAWWYDGKSGRQTHPAGQKQPNPWGLYDMHGNVWEWVNDWYNDSYYSRRPSTDPAGPSEGNFRVLRGGSWSNSAWGLRSASRNYYSPDSRNVISGFRLAFSPGQ
jgi:formylglycine-generating enzyme required for sulfatase activity